MASAQILRAARARIADPIHWTTGHLARDERGAAIYPTAKGAVCWCAYGALAADGYVLGSREMEAIRLAAYSNFGTKNVALINDEHGHAAVLAIYDNAIASAEASA